jgi:hypothetical protein
MSIVKFVIVSLLAHVVLIGGLYSYDRFYLEPKREREAALKKADEERQAAEEAQKKKLIEKGTAEVVSPEEPEKPAEKPAAEPKDPTAPTGRPEDYPGFDKPAPSEKRPELPPEDEFELELPE